MVKIYKYKIRIEEEGIIKGRIAVPLKVDWQGDDLCVWCMVSDSLPEIKIKFYVVPTGYEFNLKEGMIYATTIQDGVYVWHIFYEITEKPGGKKGEN